MSVTEKRPICSSCHQPLWGELVASACNHVFHRGCLSAAIDLKKSCAQCNEDLRPKLRTGLLVRIVGLISATDWNGQLGVCDSPNEDGTRWTVRLQNDEDLGLIKSLKAENLEADISQASLHLYGVNFGEGIDEGFAALAAPKPQEDSAAAVARQERLREVRALLGKRNQARKLQKDLADQREQIHTAREEFLRQANKHSAIAKSLQRKKDEKFKHERDNEKEKEHHGLLLGKIDLARQRDAAHEYWDKIKAGHETQALRYISTMVATVASPARIVVEVARLRAHVKESLAKLRTEAGLVADRLREKRHQLEELQREERRATQPERPRGSQEQAAKRLRS
mmetsp:Transcript_57779/g.149218  ORF Transcript_57779/g.149218 Transcript_57779/m.149218 type:complete len:340 (+) Transcript_57779:191-1210(+)